MTSLTGINTSTISRCSPAAQLPRHDRRALEAARGELEYRCETLSLDAMVARTRLPAAVVAAYLESIGAWSKATPRSANVKVFTGARVLRKQLEDAINKVQTSLPAPYVAPPAPPEAGDAPRQPRLHRDYADLDPWYRGLHISIPLGLAASVGAWYFVSGSWRMPAVALAAGVIGALPVPFTKLRNYLETRRVDKHNKAVTSREAALIAEHNQKEAVEAPKRAERARVHDAWRAGVDGDQAARADRIGVEYFEPITRVLHGVRDSGLRALAAQRATEVVSVMLRDRRAELTIGAVAEVTQWRGDMEAKSVEVGQAAALGFEIDHFDPTQAAARDSVATRLMAIGRDDRCFVAHAYRARYFEKDTARVAGDRDRLTATLTMLKRGCFD